MGVKTPNAISTGFLLQPRFKGKITFSTAPPHLLDVLHLKSLSATRIYNSGTASLSSNDYLVSSLSLSPDSEEALHIAKRKPYSIISTENADSVISLFKDYGFSDTHIAKIFSLCPELLTYNPHKVLKPKLDFLAQSGISGDSLVRIIATSPRVLTRSLHTRIIPCVNFLKTTMFNNDHHALASFLLNRCADAIFRYFCQSTTPANVETLRRQGVPDSNILKLLLMGGGSQCLGRDTESFNNNLREIQDMGFDLSSPMFPYGIRVFSSMRKEKWVSKMEVIKKSFGWSDDQQVLDLFVKQPAFMKLSKKKLSLCLEIFMKRLEWTPDYIAKYPVLLTCSLGKRILPRIHVLEILQTEGLVDKEKMSMGSALKMTEARFLSMFVDKYQQDHPQLQLMETYSESMLNLEFGSSKSN